MARFLKVLGLVVLLAAGALLAGVVVAGGRAADTTTATTTGGLLPGPTTTLFETTTVEHTTTQRVFVPTGTTTTSESENSETSAPVWAWVVIGLLVFGLILLVVLLTHHREGGLDANERHRRLDRATASWLAQGWALDSQTAESAVLRRGSELMLITVDGAGHVSTRPLAQGS